MPPITFRDVRVLGLKLPGAEAGTAYGAPDQRDDLLAEASDIYYLTDHYVDYPIVLVRLSRVRLDALGGLLKMAHSFASADKRRLRAARRRPRTGSRRSRRG